MTRLQASAQMFRRASSIVRLAAILDLLTTGVGYSLGPPSWSSSSTLGVIKSLPVPVSCWGVLLAAAGLLAAIPWTRTVGHLAAGVLLAFWGLATAITIHTGAIAAWGGPWHLLDLAVLHFALGAGDLWERRVPHDGR